MAELNEAILFLFSRGAEWVERQRKSREKRQGWVLQRTFMEVVGLTKRS